MNVEREVEKRKSSLEKFRLAGKIALVIGASLGIGRAIALGQPAVSLVDSLRGTTQLFDDATLAKMYPNHGAYAMAVENAKDAAVQAGFLMPEDGELIKAAAAASHVGNP